NFGGWYGVHCDGAYAGSAIISASNLLPLPDGASFREGAVATDGLATPLHVCERANITDNDTVAIIGAAGRIGIHLCQLAAIRGANVIGLETSTERMKHVRKWGPNEITTMDVTNPDLPSRLRSESPHAQGPTVVVDTVGDKKTLRSCWDALSMGGRVVTLTTHHNRKLPVPLREYVEKESSLMGSRYATKDQVVRAARMLADERIKPVITQDVSLEEIPDLHESIRRGDHHGISILAP
ncbi:MAG: zinc-binding dehydrogenase, partial [Halobacteriaceae archaeon]